MTNARVRARYREPIIGWFTKDFSATIGLDAKPSHCHENRYLNASLLLRSQLPMSPGIKGSSQKGRFLFNDSY